MTRYAVRVALRIAGVDVDAFTDRLMAELAASNDGADLDGSVTSGAFDVWVTEEAGSPTEAVVLGAATVRAAPHAVLGTRGESWPDRLRETGVEANEVAPVGAVG